MSSAFKIDGHIDTSEDLHAGAAEGEAYFARWRRAREQARFIVDGIKKMCSEDGSRYPDWFSLEWLEWRTTETLAEAYKESEELRREEAVRLGHDSGD